MVPRDMADVWTKKSVTKTNTPFTGGGVFLNRPILCEPISKLYYLNRQNGPKLTTTTSSYGYSIYIYTQP